VNYNDIGAFVATKKLAGRPVPQAERAGVRSLPEPARAV
jgi:hypothetical protein